MSRYCVTLLTFGLRSLVESVHTRPPLILKSKTGRNGMITLCQHSRLMWTTVLKTTIGPWGPQITQALSFWDFYIG